METSGIDCIENTADMKKSAEVGIELLPRNAKVYPGRECDVFEAPSNIRYKAIIG